MKNIKILLVCFLISLFFIDNSRAETVSDKSNNILTLDQVIEMALKANHNMLISKFNAQAAKEAKKEAVTQFLPKIKTEYDFKYNNEPEWVGFVPDGTGVERFVIGTHDNYRWTTSAIQTIFQGLAIFTNYQMSDIRLNIAEINKAVTKLETILAAKKGYFAVQNAKLLVEVAEQSIKSLQEHLSVANEYYDVGLSPKIDVLNAEVELYNAQQSLEKAKNKVVVSKAALNNIIDHPVDSPLNVTGSLELIPFSTPYRECSNKAVKLRPGLKEARNNLELAKKQIRLVSSAFYPHVTASINYNRGGEQWEVDGSDYLDRESWNVMVKADWTIFEFGKTYFARLKAKEELKKAERRIIIVEDQIRFDVKKAYEDLQTALHNIKVAEKGVESAEENLSISAERYKEQVATTTEVLDAQTRLTASRTALANVLNDYNVNLAILYRSMGIEE